jgi:hypothetical protein
MIPKSSGETWCGEGQLPPSDGDVYQQCAGIGIVYATAEAQSWQVVLKHNKTIPKCGLDLNHQRRSSLPR